MSPTARTLAECKRRGWTAQVVERFNFYTKRKTDLFGCIDVVACVPPGIGFQQGGALTLYSGAIVGIQTTSGAHHADRSAKIAAEPRMRAWHESGGHIAVWSWSKRGGKGKRKLWVLREEAVVL